MDPGHPPRDVEDNLAGADALEHFDRLLVRQIMADHSVDCENLVALEEIVTICCLAILHNSLDKDAECAPGTIIATDNSEAQGFAARPLLEKHRVEGVRVALLEAAEAVPLARYRAEVLRQPFLTVATRLGGGGGCLGRDQRTRVEVTIITIDLNN